MRSLIHSNFKISYLNYEFHMEDELKFSLDFITNKYSLMADEEQKIALKESLCQLQKDVSILRDYPLSYEVSATSIFSYLNHSELED